MRTKSVVLATVGVVLVAVGVTLVAFLFLWGTAAETATNAQGPRGLDVPEAGPDAGPGRAAAGGGRVGDAAARGPGAKAPGGKTGPEDKTLRLTIPQMARIENDTIPDAAGDDEGALRRSAAIHLKCTGFPWQRVANVYLAGHRLGYPNTDSWLAFWDLNELEEGDEVYVKDAAGTKYTYRVTEEFVVEPTDLSVLKPVPGKNVLTLQTCTLPDYSDRLIVRAELVGKSEG